jgi:hypothetical protein
LAKRRSRGDGGIRWSESRQRWIAEIAVGYTPIGKRIVRSASRKTKTEAQSELKDMLRDLDDGLTPEDRTYTVAQAVRDFLKYGLPRRTEAMVQKLSALAEHHIIPDLGRRKARELSAEEVDKWLARKAKVLSTRTLRDLLSVLRRAIARTQKRDKVKRNVVLLCEIPEGRPGRPSKSLTFEQAEAILKAAEGTPMRAYVGLRS